jgi:hypothetical protein
MLVSGNGKTLPKRKVNIMKKKLLGLTAALGITALASWAVPAAATDPILACTTRLCIGQPADVQCICPSGKVIYCSAFFHGGCSA